MPVPDGSITDFIGILEPDVTVDEINEAFRAAAESGPLAKVLVYTEEPLVVDPTSSARRPRAPSTPG